ncbi:MAG: ferrous iron transporter B [Oscillospiraceae bacterium]|nr:ferrous iron transporter B [Oscillospiraceae bacterium]MCL2279336.1 ferrous iron transporter B [Oscillospiraceae bacterium]
MSKPHKHKHRHEINPQDRILLMGNPNVGKSVFFTELTGIHAISSNYVGTTVSYMHGHLPIGDKEYTLIDVPGTYSLSPSSDAEAVAVKFVGDGAKAVICVLDASNLERNLALALELRQCNIPIVYTLNLTDIAERRGIEVNHKLLEQELGAPVIPTVAVKKSGINELLDTLRDMLGEGYEASCKKCQDCSKERSMEQKEIWETAKQISRRVCKKTMSKPGFLDKLGENMTKPFPGIFIAVLVMALLIGVVVGGGRALRALFLLRLFSSDGGIVVEFFRNLFASFVPEGVFLNILTGDFGIFVISFEWILALIFPYVLMFYIGFSFLEDSGYLPRISVLFDNIMRKLGVQGGSLIHTLMGLGCAVPAIIGSRAATTRKERIVISAAICFAIPCISQTGALLSLTAAFSWWMMPAMVLFGLFIFVVVSLISGKLVKGKVDPLIIEVPNLLMPDRKAYGRKLLIRMKHFFKDAEIPMMAAVVLAALLAETGALNVIARYAEPLMSRWLGMPSEAVVALILGIVRREMSVAPLLALDLTTLQAFVGGIVSLLYIPCLSVFAILVKEFKLRIAAVITVSTIVIAIFVGGLVNQIAQLFI